MEMEREENQKFKKHLHRHERSDDLLYQHFYFTGLLLHIHLLFCTYLCDGRYKQRLANYFQYSNEFNISIDFFTHVLYIMNTQYTIQKNEIQKQKKILS